MDISSAIIRDILFFAASKGTPIEKLTQSLGISLNDLHNDDYRFPLALADLTWRESVAFTGDTLLGLHSGIAADFSSAGLVGFLMQNSPTLYTALLRASEYYSLFSNLIHIELIKNGEHTALTLTPIPQFESCFGAKHAVEGTMSFTMNAVRKLTSKKIIPTYISFTTSFPKEIESYESIFQSNIDFGAKSNCIRFRNQDLELPVITYNRHLYDLLNQEASRLLVTQKNLPILVLEVQHCLNQLFQSEFPHLELVARKLKKSTRSLQRELQELGFTFQDILEETRKEIALAYVQNPKYSFSEIAFLLGYAESSIFTRSFKRWTGKTPKEFRESKK
ncbi:MAG: AraC family transcriptional regulator [Chloroherpetonaceae bacterium]|nr:AraC family transcriptional regulator [Chloroherpetonaceae bacterium]